MFKISVCLIALIALLPRAYGAADAKNTGAGTSGDWVHAPAQEVPALQERALQVLIAHSGKIAQNKEQFAALYPFQQDRLFVESIQCALSKRLGFHVLTTKPDMPLDSHIFSRERLHCFSPDGKIMAIYAWNSMRGTTHLRAVATGQLIVSFEGQLDVTFSSAGNIVALTQRANRETRLWNIASSKLLGVFKGEIEPCFSRDGTILASEKLATALEHKEIRLRNVTTGQLMHTFQSEISPMFSPDGTILVSGSMNFGYRGVLALHNLTTDELIGTFQRESYPVFSPDNRVLITGVKNEFQHRYDDLRLRNAKTGQLIAALVGEGGEKPIFSLDGNMYAIQVRNNTNQNCEVRLRDAHTGQLIHRFAGTTADGYGQPVFSPDGTMIALGGVNGKTGCIEINLCDTSTGALINTFKRAHDPVFNPQGTVIAFRSKDTPLLDTETRLYNAVTGELIKVFDGDDPKFSPDGAALIMKSEAGLLLKNLNFRSDIALLNDFDMRVFVLKAAHDWLEHKAHSVAPDDILFYQRLIALVPYLNDPLLFDVSVDAEHDVYV